MESTLQSEPPAEEGFVMATCRTCKNRSDKMHSVFEVIDNCIVSEMLIALASIQISNDDNLPKSICKLCIEQLKNAYNFKLQCETVDASFRNYLDRCVKKENDAFANQTDPNPVSMDCLLPPDNNLMNKANESGQSSLLDSKSDKNVDFVEFHDDKVVFTCRECLKVYYSVESLRSHKQSAHLGYTYKCKDCNKEFSRSSSLRYHRQVHESRKSYSCRICKQSLTRLEHLKRHLLVHLKEKPFNCEQCQRGFTRQERLEMHLPKCTGVKGYICDICNKCCLREAGLIEHKKLHVNAKPTMLTMEDLKNYADYYDVYEDNVLSPLDKSTTEDAADSDSDGNEDVNLSGACDKAIASDYAHEPTDRSEIFVFDEENIKIEEDEMFGNNDSELNSICKETKSKLSHQCADCLMTFKNIRKLEQHAWHAHNGKRLHKCNICQKEFCRSDNYTRHVVTIHKVFKPRRRPKIVKGKEPVRKAEYKCNDCDVVYKNIRKLEKHVWQVHNRKRLHKCSICNKEFCRSDNLIRHIKSHDAPQLCKCDICQETFDSLTKLQNHKIMHKDEPLIFTCTICSNIYEQEEMLKKHMQEHKIKFQCPICDKSFTSEKYRNLHVQGHSDEKPFTCPTCNKKFLTKTLLNKHKKFHNDEDKPYLCTECGQRFIRNYLLTVHMRRHRGEKPFKCRHCEKGFARYSDLTVHERYHTGEKKHLCTICGMGFIRSTSLTVHMRTHTGEKPYKCKYCEASFAQSNDLKAHIRRHTGERFECEFCSQKFLMGYLLNQHKRTVHGLNVESNIKRLNSVKETVQEESPNNTWKA